MAARVFAQAGVRSTLKVSLPGFDARNAPLSGLAFDAQFGLLQVIARGTVQLPLHNPAIADSVAVFFEPQPIPPLVYCHLRGSAAGGSPAGSTPFRVRNNNPSFPTHLYFEAYSFTNQVVFGFANSNGQLVNYVVLRQLAG